MNRGNVQMQVFRCYGPGFSSISPVKNMGIRMLTGMGLTLSFIDDNCDFLPCQISHSRKTIS